MQCKIAFMLFPKLPTVSLPRRDRVGCMFCRSPCTTDPHPCFVSYYFPQRIAGVVARSCGASIVLAQVLPHRTAPHLTIISPLSRFASSPMYLSCPPFFLPWIRPAVLSSRRVDFRELVRDLFAVYKVGARRYIARLTPEYRVVRVARACFDVFLPAYHLRITICRV